MENLNYGSMVSRLADNKLTRNFLIRQIDKQLYKNIVTEDEQDLYKVTLRRYQFLSAMLKRASNNIDKGYLDKNVLKKLSKVFVDNSFRK
mgnify:CR=1 FL=1